MKTEGAMHTLDAYGTAPDQGADCQRCQKSLGEAWSSGQLCSDCGLDYELSRPETRWIDDGDLRAA